MTDLLPQVQAALRNVFDPETGRDLIAMGMIYGCQVQDGTARITMTTTTRGCPLTDMLRSGVEAVVLAVPGVLAAEVVLTWDPPWTLDRMESPTF